MSLFRILVVMLALQFANCRNAKPTAQPEKSGGASQGQPAFAPGPHVFVYKTRTDMSDMVPVILSPDGSSIASYPDPSDLRGASGPPLPTALHKGYLLDNRGINAHVAFVTISYRAYAALQAPPSVRELMGMIKDKDPLTELCDCGIKNAYTDLEHQMNQLIDDGTLRTKCKVVR